jgi:hypothetical protein
MTRTRRVDRLPQPPEGGRVASVLRGVGESVVVLGHHAAEAREELPVSAEERGPGARRGIGSGHARDLDARDRVPGHVLEGVVRVPGLRATEEGVAGVPHPEDRRRCDERDGQHQRGQGREGPATAAAGRGQDEGARKQHSSRHRRRPLGAERRHRRDDREGPQGRADEVETVQAAGGQRRRRQESPQHEAAPREGHGVEDAQRHAREEGHEEADPRAAAPVLDGRRGIQDGRRRDEPQAEHRRPHADHVAEGVSPALGVAREPGPGGGEAEHGQGEDEEGEIVEQLRRHDAVDGHLREEGGPRREESQCARARLP